MLKMAVISLTTDFGLADGFVGIMKGVILCIAPHVCFVDLTHEVAPQDVRQAAYVLARAAPYFPAQTIHLAVVDPGVGSARRPLLVTTERAAYVGPDNGIFTHALAEPGAQAWELDQPRFWLPQVSRTFHGRDIFAPSGSPPRKWRFAEATRPPDRRSCAARLGRTAPSLRRQPERRDRQHRPLRESDQQHPRRLGRNRPLALPDRRRTTPLC